jgi:SAM-dependent methyltransferase
MTKFLFFVSIWCIHWSAYSQNFLEFNGADRPDSLWEKSDQLICFMRNIEANNVADIGSGDLRLILNVANHYHDKTFVFEDIDPGVCNTTAMHKMIKEENLIVIDTNNISLQIGGVKSTFLPTNQFDLVLVLGTIHNMEYIHEMFDDIRRILKPNGKLILQCPLTEFPNDAHKQIGCFDRVLTYAEFDQLIIREQLRVLKDWRFKYEIQDGNDYNNMMRFVLCVINPKP